MKKYIIIINMILILTNIIKAQFTELELNFSKDTYYIAEPIDVGITLKNISSNLIYTNGRIELNLFDKSGTLIQFTGSTGDHFSPTSNSLKPGEEDYKVIMLNEYFGKRISALTTHRYIETGTYQLEASYYNESQNLAIVRKSFTIEQPLDNEAIVYNSYIQTFRNIINGNNTTSAAAESMQTLINQYPNSVYAPIILIWLDAVYLYQLNDKAMSNKIVETLLERYISSSLVLPFFRDYLKKVTSQTEKTNFINKIITENKNPVMDKVLKKELIKHQQ